MRTRPANPPLFDLFVVGEINPDLILRDPDIAPAFGQAEKLVEEATLTIGSSSVIMACGAARLGLRVAFCGLVGDDIFGRFMLESMRERGVDTSACVIDPRGRPTGLSVILAYPGGDRAILTHPGNIADMTIDQIDRSLLARARHLHVSSYFLLDGLRPDLPGLFLAARQMGLTTSLDTNFDPSGEWQIGKMLDYCDIFLPNETEALAISGAPDLLSALDALSRRVGTVAIKLGADGAVARRRGEEVRARPLPVTVVDAVGAGDSFDAGFIYGALDGRPLTESLRLGLACGSLSVTAAGGTAAQPTLEEALAAIEKHFAADGDH